MSISARQRAAAEIAFEVVAVLAYIWILDRNAPDWLKVPFFWLVCVGFPIWCIARQQRYFPEFSLDWNAVNTSLRSVVWFTVVGTCFLSVVAISMESFHYDDNLFGRVFEYIFWSFLQQLGLQTFLTRRFQKIFSNPMSVACAAATVFAAFHFPNPVLVVLTWIGALVWCLTYQRTPNLYALAVSHGWLAVGALYCIPVGWLHQLRVGPGYWTFTP